MNINRMQATIVDGEYCVVSITNRIGILMNRTKTQGGRELELPIFGKLFVTCLCCRGSGPIDREKLLSAIKRSGVTIILARCLNSSYTKLPERFMYLDFDLFVPSENAVDLESLQKKIRSSTV